MSEASAGIWGLFGGADMTSSGVRAGVLRMGRPGVSRATGTGREEAGVSVDFQPGMSLFSDTPAVGFVIYICDGAEMGFYKLDS